ncbi:MAG: PAS domain S-box protein [Chloroflexi bacterium]|nr:PAS domain S-box protein [Chloroflexota bacterium]
MSPQETALLYFTIVCIVLLSSMSALTFTHSRVAGANVVWRLCGLMALWLVAYLLEVINPDRAQKVFWDSMQWIPPFLAGYLTLQMVARMARRPWRRAYAVVLIPALGFVLLVLTNDQHQWFFSQTIFIEQPPYNAVYHEFGLGANLAIGYVYLLMSWALVGLARYYRVSYGHERKRVIYAFLGVTLGLATYIVLFASGTTIFGQRNPAPLAFSIGLIPVFWGIFRYRTFDILPVARDRLLENLSDAVIVLDMVNRIAELNLTARKWAGMDEAQAVGLSIDAVFPDWRLQSELAPGLGQVEVERVVSQPEGVRTLSLRFEPIRGSRGKDVGRLLIARDITEAVRLREQLRQSEEQLRAINDYTRDIIVLMDAQTVIRYASASFARTLGYAPEAVIGQSALRFICQDDLTPIGEMLGQIRDWKEISSYIRFRLIRADGQLLWVESSGAAVTNEQREPIGIVAVARDISEQRTLEKMSIERERLEAALAKEHELSDLKNRMMVRIAHEFRTPLSVIQTSSEMLTRYTERMTPEQRARHSESVQSETRRITNMLDTISNVIGDRLIPQKIRSGTFTLEALFTECIEQQRALRGFPQTFNLHVSEAIPLSADYTTLHAAVTQVLGNAVQFSPLDSTIAITLTREGDQVVAVVADRGIGIPEAELPRVFEPFFRGTNIGEVSGLGLGLTIAQTAITAHGGTIAVKSRLNEGTSVTLRLPVDFPGFSPA